MSQQTLSTLLLMVVFLSNGVICLNGSCCTLQENVFSLEFLIIVFSYVRFGYSAIDMRTLNQLKEIDRMHYLTLLNTYIVQV